MFVIYCLYRLNLCVYSTRKPWTNQNTSMDHPTTLYQASGPTKELAAEALRDSLQQKTTRHLAICELDFPKGWHLISGSDVHDPVDPREMAAISMHTIPGIHPPIYITFITENCFRWLFSPLIFHSIGATEEKAIANLVETIQHKTGRSLYWGYKPNIAGVYMIYPKDCGPSSKTLTIKVNPQYDDLRTWWVASISYQEFYSKFVYS